MRPRSTSQLRAEITTLQERIRQLEAEAALDAQAVEALRLREDELRALTDHCPDVIARFDPDLRHMYVSPAIQAITGRPPDAFIGKTNRELGMPDALVAEWEAVLRHVFTTGQAVTFDFEFPSSRGPLYYEARLTPERAADGAIQSVFGVSRDITARKRAEMTLVESEARYRLLFEHSLDGILQTAPDGRILAANSAACRMLGWREEELVRIGRAGVVDLTDPRLPTLLEERARTGKSRGELLFVRKDGTKFPCQISSVVFSDRDGALRTSMVIQDLSERKRVEEALHESERFARATIDALAAHICVLNEIGTIVAVNRAWRDFAAENFADPGRVAEGADYLAVCDAATGPDAAIATAWAAGLRAVMKKERDEFSLEYPCHSPTEQRWFTGTASRFAEYDPARVVVAHENVTARRLAEIGLRTSEEKYRIVADNTYDWEFWRGPDGRFVYVSPSCERITGHAAEEFVADPELFRRIIHPDDRRRLGDEFWDMREDLNEEQEFRVLRPDGTERWVGHVCRPIRDAGGHFLGRRGSTRDITERKKAEEGLDLRNQQLQALLDAARELNTTLDVGAVMRRLAAIGMELVGATAGMAGLVENEELAFTEYNDGGVLRPVRYRFSLGQGVSGLVMQTKVPYIGNAGQDDPHVTPEIREALGFTNCLNVPVLDRQGRVLGCFEVFNGVGGRPFTQKDVAILEGVAASAAIAIENSTLFAEIQRSRERLQALSRRQVEMQEDERRALARELHDEIGQLLTGLKLTLDMLAGTVTAEGLESLRESQELVAALMRDIRDLSLNLRPPILDDLGLLPALLWQIERYTLRTHVQVTFRHSGLDSRPCSPAVETAAYRIVQEALTNVARHAQVEAVRVWVRVMKGELVIIVEDQGGGFDQSLVSTSGFSVGLVGMQERVTLLGGRLHIESSPGAGTRVAVTLPLVEGR